MDKEYEIIRIINSNISFFEGEEFNKKEMMLEEIIDCMKSVDSSIADLNINFIKDNTIRL